MSRSGCWVVIVAWCLLDNDCWLVIMFFWWYSCQEVMVSLPPLLVVCDYYYTIVRINPTSTTTTSPTTKITIAFTRITNEAAAAAATCVKQLHLRLPSRILSRITTVGPSLFCITRYTTSTNGATTPGNVKKRSKCLRTVCRLKV